jgi:hypothetical protein
MLRNIYLGLALSAGIFNFVFDCVTLQMRNWALDSEPENVSVVVGAYFYLLWCLMNIVQWITSTSLQRAYIGLWEQCNVNSDDSARGSGTSCQSSASFCFGF